MRTGRLRSVGNVDGTSPFSTFMLVVIFAFFVYVVGGKRSLPRLNSTLNSDRGDSPGCIYLRQNEGATGIEACPHHQFWCALPAIAMGALSSITGKIDNRPSTKGFERVPTQPTSTTDYGSSSSVARDSMF